MLKYFNQASQLTMEVRFTNKPAKICMKDTHLYIIVALFLGVDRPHQAAHSHHHHEDAGNGHEDVRNGHDRLVSRDGQSHGCGCVGHQHDTEHEQEEGLGCHFQTYTQTELSDLQVMAHSCDLICDAHFYY